FNAEKYERCVVVAVIKDIYEQMVTDEARPMGFRPRSFCQREYFSDPGEGDWGTPRQIVLTYERGMRDEFTEAVEQLMKQKFPSYVYDLKFSEDVLTQKLRSETNLMLILSIITAVCILVAVFGVYSIVTLACAQRRKEIALRKIHGATLADILSIFIKEYGLIVLAASAVAFPLGYMIMKEWVAQYVKQAPIAWWIYAVILLAIVLLIALSVGSRVWRTARENPAEVIKRGN
ncbi:MAG: FtsX-like permease family protein, partial [Bacteroidaceae bacterium]|nr:FtsX-like permease family protein [Bacteroidaceae bacterium]